ncbi:MAG: AraC family transcriptional regulator [Nostoc sp.]|uniref:AraC family transcriptional regulator n=1 Tax=Nostoc sp. TaxID=1180 RepID=UPI002FF816FB
MVELNTSAKSHQNLILEAQRSQANRAELIDRIARLAQGDGSVQYKQGLFLISCSAPTQPLHVIHAPAFCVVAQGSKEVLLGNDRYRYDSAHYLLSTVELPTVNQVIEASHREPYLGLRLEFDPSLITAVMMESKFSLPRSETEARAITVSRLDGGLLDAVVRLVRLLDQPAEYDFLAPLTIREIVYWLLVGKQGKRLCHLAVVAGNAHRIAKAVELIRQNFDQPLKIDSVARDLGMSASSFHHHFKAVTSMSPLQFQKQIRLQEARRLMLGEDLDAFTAGNRVGYEDASHFSREYKRLFGEPPLRDVDRLRESLS